MNTTNEQQLLKPAIICVIEADIKNIDSDNTHHIRYFEKEAINCFSQIRKQKNDLKDIPIHCICITKNKISSKTKNKFKELNVEYHDSYQAITETFDCGFYNKVLGCKILEEELNYNRYLHLDLDMFLVKDLTYDLFDIEQDASCLVYDDLQKLQERKHNGEIYNTCFIVTKAETKLYDKWWDKLLKMDQQYKNSDFNYNVKDLDYRKIEEYSFDMLNLNIKPIHDIIFGETYTNLNQIPINSIYFHHYHIIDNY